MGNRRWRAVLTWTGVLALSATFLTGVQPTASAAPAPAPTGAPTPGLPQLPTGSPPAVAEGGSGAPEVVIEGEDRQRVAHVRSSPHGMIGSILVRFNGQYDRCSGAFVGPNTILTAAHCLYDPDRGGKADYIKFLAAESPADAGYIECVVRNKENMRVPQAFINDPTDENNDFGVIKPPQCHLPATPNSAVNIIDYTGWFGWSGADRYGQIAELAGYPKEVNDVAQDGQMWFDEARITKTQPHLIQYRMDASVGQSGAPVFDFLNSPVPGWYVLGVHAGGGRVVTLTGFPKRNWGPRLAGQHSQMLTTWFTRQPRPEPSTT